LKKRNSNKDLEDDQVEIDVLRQVFEEERIETQSSHKRRSTSSRIRKTTTSKKDTSDLDSEDYELEK
jgi:hypothetical protein